MGTAASLAEEPGPATAASDFHRYCVAASGDEGKARFRFINFDQF
jgi:hypothetical protein